MMKKLLIIALVLLGLSSAVIAQNPKKVEPSAKTVKTEKADTIAATILTPAIEMATIESISAKIDQFMVRQSETNSNLEDKIDRANRRMQSLQNESSLRWLFRDLIPVAVLALIGAFLIAVVYVFTNNNYRNNMLKYDSLIKCVEKTGAAPDFFNKVEQQKSYSASAGGRVHLILSLLCGVIGSLFLVVTMNSSKMLMIGCSFIGTLLFMSAAFMLFKQYNKISENSRKEQ